MKPGELFKNLYEITKHSEPVFILIQMEEDSILYANEAYERLDLKERQSIAVCSIDNIIRTTATE